MILSGAHVLNLKFRKNNKRSHLTIYNRFGEATFTSYKVDLDIYRSIQKIYNKSQWPGARRVAQDVTLGLHNTVSLGKGYFQDLTYEPAVH